MTSLGNERSWQMNLPRDQAHDKATKMGHASQRNVGVPKCALTPLESTEQDDLTVRRQTLKQRPLFHRQLARSSSVASCAISTLAVAAGLFASAHAAAQDHRPRDVSGWTLTESEDRNGCFLTKQYDGRGKTTLLLGLDIDGTNRLSVLNDNWSINPHDRLRLSFRLSNGGYTGQVAIGIVADGKHGFVTTFEPKFPAYFATSAALHISRGNVPVEQLSLAGSGAAVAELRRCADAQRAAATKRASQADGDVASAKQSAIIPKDPFAPAPKRHAKP